MTKQADILAHILLCLGKQSLNVAVANRNCPFSVDLI